MYESYITVERIGQCKHEFETQVNEGMNTCVAKYAPKGRHYSKTVSLEARVKVVAGIYNVGYHFFWTEIMKELGIDIEPSVEEYLLKKDLDKLRKFNRDHDHTNSYIASYPSLCICNTLSYSVLIQFPYILSFSLLLPSYGTSYYHSVYGHQIDDQLVL